VEGLMGGGIGVRVRGRGGEDEGRTSRNP